MTAQQRGRQFEVNLASELGLETTPASGAVWYSKLDVKGKKTRWSLKHTDANTFSINIGLISEAVKATQGIEGDGAIPMWAISIGGIDETLVMMRVGDFKLIQEGENLIDVLPSRSDERRKRASLPILLRTGSNDEFK